MRIQKEKRQSRNIFIPLIIALIVSSATYYYNKSWIVSVVVLAIIFVLLTVYLAVRQKLKRHYEIKKMEEVFPDFIQLMASNLRAGMTIDKALLLSSRKEFAPLDTEIVKLGKDIVTGKEIDVSLSAMAKRIQSDKITKTISLIISGIRSGGNLAILLEQTAANMRERNFVEKRAASNVLMYVIFIFFAVAVGAPVLFSLSSVLVGVLTSLFANLPAMDAAATARLPLTLTKVAISTEFVTYFSLTFIVVSDILASLVLGLVSKGEEKEGVKYIAPIVLLSVACFFGVKYILGTYFAGFFG